MITHRTAGTSRRRTSTKQHSSECGAKPNSGVVRRGERELALPDSKNAGGHRASERTIGLWPARVQYRLQ
jgi:hypothetical protein